MDAPDYDGSPAHNQDSREFQAAMDRYQQRDYSGAIPALRSSLEVQPQSVEARFYLGICLLLTSDRAGGIEELKAVTAAGNTPYLEPARFYLAKALLADGNIRGADVQLRVIVEMHGKFEKRAQALHDQIVPTP